MYLYIKYSQNCIFESIEKKIYRKVAFTERLYNNNYYIIIST